MNKLIKTIQKGFNHSIRYPLSNITKSNHTVTDIT